MLNVFQKVLFFSEVTCFVTVTVVNNKVNISEELIEFYKNEEMWIKRKGPYMKVLFVCVCYKFLSSCVHWGLEPGRSSRHNVGILSGSCTFYLHNFIPLNAVFLCRFGSKCTSLKWVHNRRKRWKPKTRVCYVDGWWNSFN